LYIPHGRSRERGAICARSSVPADATAATIVRAVVCVAYLAALAALAWTTGHPADGGDSEAGVGGRELVLSLLVLAGWAAWSALVGYLAGPVALMLVVSRSSSRPRSGATTTATS
jgi:hypothetical protein